MKSSVKSENIKTLLTAVMMSSCTNSSLWCHHVQTAPCDVIVWSKHSEVWPDKNDPGSGRWWLTVFDDECPWMWKNINQN